ncbi:DNA alkylation repair protein [Pseudoalteromonas luteoviolacea]|uniref:Putative DNA alkylation repair enzyme n=1 Tax=Pseudoalteromonas luteoviolacea (strain 2ta16) TaxID=1353533 RepID=V4HL44_PSEL2|nr:DNA alkylation repair protein [Pseudoalteromonas luteoviolacea]ESP91545.1 putative DNA alkylation repair enzyme [Pseudoalteromonas luteoviolacea 2ta16]KZN40192.1 hypothetical protein N483_18555 [Pseudoalteromonas luteoviolacea NCIMB 1944]
MHIKDIALGALAELGYPKQKIKTAQARQLSATLYRQLTDHQIESVLHLCEQLLEERDWMLSLIAYDWAFRVKKQYTLSTFDIFERWLLQYITDWYDCDDFCTHAFGELMVQYPELIDKTHPWAMHSNFAVRRAVAVILIYPLNKGKFPLNAPLNAANLLFNDQHDLVQKGYGWLLKVLSKSSPDVVINYLKTHHKHMPRVAFRYALEKLDKQTKTQLMSL